MNQLVDSHEKFRLGTKALLALRQNIEMQHYKKERILFAFKLYVIVYLVLLDLLVVCVSIMV